MVKSWPIALANNYDPLQDDDRGPASLPHTESEGAFPLEIPGGTPFLNAVDSALRVTPQSALGSKRRWVHVDERGAARVVEIDKHQLVSDLGIRYRDLLALDPTVPIPSPSNLLIRERAMVVNLEAVRMIVCANQVYVLSVPKDEDPSVAAAPHPDSPFVRQLCRVLLGGASASRGSLQALASSGFDPFSGMPFELRALECALDAAVQQLAHEVAGLEGAAYPALQRLAAGVSRQALEAVSSCKGVLNRLIARVQRIRQELENIMSDDMDMQDMYLKRRAELSGQPLPPQPPALPTSRPHRTFGNLLLALQQEPPSSASTPRLHHAASSGSELARAGSDSTGQGLAQAAAGSSAAPGEEAAAGGTGVAGEGAQEHQAAGPQSSNGEDRGGKSRGGELWGKSRAAMRRAGLVVRTVRRLHRKPSGARQRPEGGGASDAGAGSGGDGDAEEGSVIEEVEEEMVCKVDPHDVAEAEDLLEAYFMQVDYLLRRLVLLSERTTSTEALLGIEMDHRRNELVALDLFVTSVTGSFAFVGMVAGIFGMNLPFGGWAQHQATFALVLGLTFMGGISLLVLVLWHVRRRRLMFISSLS